MFDSIFSVTTMVAVVMVFGFYFFIKKKEGKDWIRAIYFITVLVTGTALYALGLSYKDDPDIAFLPLFIIARAIGLALKCFGGDFGASSISKLAQDNTIFAVAILVHFITAIILTFIIAIKLFGKNIENRIHVFYNKLFCSKYIVVGASEQAKVFLQSFNYKKRKRTTVILEAEQKNKKDDLMYNGFAVVVIRDGGDKQLTYQKGEKKDIAEETAEALKIAGLHRNKRNTKIVAMSKDDEVNLLVAKIVTDYIAKKVEPAKDNNGRVKKLSQEQEKELIKHNLSVHAMYEMLDRTEHFAFSEYALGRVRFFNPYEVCARKFVFENPITSLIPKAWVNTEKARLYNGSDEGHDRPYRIVNIFIGYGHTNQHIFKKSICNYQLLGTDYNALIIDKNAKSLEKHFQNSAPGLFNVKDKNEETVLGPELMPNPDGSVYYPNPDENYNIAFEDLDVLSFDFYNRIIQEIKGCGDKNGYDFALVVIALGTDKLSIETALELRQKLYERKLLRGADGEAEYDRVWIFVKVRKDSVLTDYRLLNDENDIDNKITVFGALDEILNENYIIDEKMDFVAKRIANNYWETAGMDTQKTNVVTKWDSLTEFKRESNRCAAISIRTKLNLLGFEFKECANEMDNETIKMAKKAYYAAYDIAVSERQRTEKANGKFIDFAERDANGNIIDNARNNLARLEHQRWNALHLVSGWTKFEIAGVTANKRQNEKSKQHACITTFEGLSNLRKRQADSALAEAKKNGEQLSLDEILSEADTMCYDFDIMDMLFFGILNGSDYSVILRE